MLNVDSEPQFKGGLLLARLEYLLRHGGKALLDDVLAQLAPTDAATLRRPILSLSWYPAGLRRRVDEAIVSAIGPGDRADVLIEIGRALADAILSGSDRQFINPGAPQSFLELVPRLYDTHHTVGRREYHQLSANAGIIRTFEPGGLITIEDCWTVVGCLQRGLELFGAGAVLVMETSCRAASAPYCEYQCEWSVGDE